MSTIWQPSQYLSQKYWISCQFVIQTQLLGILNEVQTVPNDFRERSLPKVEETMKKSAKKCLKMWRPSWYLSQKYWFLCQYVFQTQLFGIPNEVKTVPNNFRERSFPKVEETMEKSAKKWTGKKFLFNFSNEIQISFHI